MRRNQIALLAIAVLGGWLLRMLIEQYDAPDSLYHLRRASFAVAEFPRTIVIDPLINFPQGGVVIWPPLFDLTLALPALVIDGPDASRELLTRTAAWVPPIYAAMTILLTGLAGMGINRRWGAAAAVVVAVLPGHVEYSVLGRTDQHVAEAFWGAALLAGVIWAVRRQSPWMEMVSGGCVAGAVLNWQGGIFWGPLVAIAIVLGACARGADRHWLRRVLLMLGFPALVVALATWFWLRGYELPFTYVSFGWFQSAFLAFTFALTAVVVVGANAARKQRLGGIGALVVAGIIGSSLFVAPFVPEMLSQIAHGVSHLGSVSEGQMSDAGAYLSYPADWLSRIREYDPLLADGGWSVAWVSLAFFAAPFAIVRWSRRFLQLPQNYHYALLVSWGTFILLFTLSQRRNVYYAAILAALAAVEISRWLGAILRRRFLDLEQRHRGATPLFFMVFVALLLPVLTNYPREVLSGYDSGERAVTFQIVGKLAQRTVDPFDSRFLEPQSRVPELAEAESVMAFWSQGHLATWYAGIPVVANNFGYGYRDSLEFFYSEDEARALEIARKHKVRWVVVFDLLPVFESYGKVLGQHGYVEEGRGFVPGSRYFRTLHARLYESDAMGGVVAGHSIRPLEHFRLRWSSGETVPRHPIPISRFKIFEIVD